MELVLVQILRHLNQVCYNVPYNQSTLASNEGTQYVCTFIHQVYSRHALQIIEAVMAFKQGFSLGI